ncbi:MAG: hypothetical protein ABSE77_19300 [Acidimicrobiales bacterium]|jgi:hypothetical protein
MAFDEAWAEMTLSELAQRGVAVEPGLTTSELTRVEAAIEANVPPELKLLWAVGVPMGNSWPKWRSDPIKQAADDREWVQHAFSFDVKANSYWLKAWGQRPRDDEEAVTIAVANVSSWPPLVRVYSHRFMPTEPGTVGGPVLSVFQAVDSIIYGDDLAHYLHKEFGASLPDWAAAGARPVPYWDDAFDL